MNRNRKPKFDLTAFYIVIIAIAFLIVAVFSVLRWNYVFSEWDDIPGLIKLWILFGK